MSYSFWKRSSYQNERKDEFCDPQINLREGSQQFHQLREGSQQFRQAADILPRQQNAAQPREIVVSNAFVDVHIQGMMYLPKLRLGTLENSAYRSFGVAKFIKSKSF